MCNTLRGIFNLDWVETVVWDSCWLPLFLTFPCQVAEGLSRSCLYYGIVKVRSTTLVTTQQDVLCQKIPVNTGSATYIPQSACGILRMLSREIRALEYLKSLFFSHFFPYPASLAVIMQIMLSGYKCVIADSPNGCICVFASLIWACLWSHGTLKLKWNYKRTIRFKQLTGQNEASGTNIAF